MGQHGPQCICEICTCGRHQCPFGRSNSSHALAFGNEYGGQGHFYRKELATFADGDERVQQVRPKGELALDHSPLSIERREDSELRPASNLNARNERFVTSAALKKRSQNSQFELGQGRGSGMRSTYREESERALQNGGAQRIRQIRPSDTTQLFYGQPGSQNSTINQTEFGEKKSERAKATRPRTSDLWKNEGAMAGTTTSREQFAEKRPERSGGPFRPRENASILGDGDRAFQRETSNLSEFGPKRGERGEARRPQNSDIFKSEERMEGRGGVNREEYGQEGRADRFPASRPNESGILKGEGTFTTETHKRAEFGPKRGEKTEAIRPKTSDLWKREGRSEQSTVSRSEYKGERGERSEPRKPVDSDIFRAQGPFERKSVASSEFDEKGPGERFATRRPGNNEVWRREGRMAEDGSVNQVEYTIEGKRGERHEMRRPKEEPLFDPDIEPNLPLSTIHRTEFVQRKGERADRKIPTEEGAELFRGDGSFHGETSKDAEYQPKKGERFEIKPQGSSDIWKSGERMEGRGGVNREEYGQEGRADRFPASKPNESGILKGEGSFANETHKRVEFGPKSGERLAAIRPVDSDLFRREGQVGLEGSINSTDYTHIRGERAERKMPKESGILLPVEGSEFAKSTVHRDEFVEKRLEEGQKNSTVTRRTKNDSSFGLNELNNAEWSELSGRTMSHEAFGPKELVDRARPVVHQSELRISEPDAKFHSSTIYSDNYQQISPNSYGSRSKVRPSTALKLNGDMELSSGYQIDYTGKIMPCPAGELAESLRNHACIEADKKHAHTENFEFHSVNKGHHLYRSKENLTEA